jgi:uncharacterized membrane protein
MDAVLLALIASISWGTADFGGGLLTRRLPVLTVLLWMETTGLVVALASIAVMGEPFPDARAALYAVAAGAAGVVALGAFYQALAVGTMSVVAPLSATGVALPVVVGVVTGDRIGPVAAAGLVVTVLGVIAASREASDEDAGAARAQRLSVLLALLAAVGFGAYFIGSDVAADSSVPWALALGRVVALPAILVVARTTRVPLRPPRGFVPLLCLVGCADLAATALYGVANTRGALAVVSVVGSLYPIATILLARVVLGERLRGAQAAGVGTALAGVTMIAAG